MNSQLGAALAYQQKRFYESMQKNATSLLSVVNDQMRGVAKLTPLVPLKPIQDYRKFGVSDLVPKSASRA